MARRSVLISFSSFLVVFFVRQDVSDQNGPDLKRECAETAFAASMSNTVLSRAQLTNSCAALGGRANSTARSTTATVLISVSTPVAIQRRRRIQFDVFTILAALP
jgi:hypothetical protein